jgi:hypothetical protein
MTKHERKWTGLSFFIYPTRAEKINGRLPSESEMSYDFLSHGTLGAKYPIGGTDDQAMAMHSISTRRILPRLFRPDRYGRLSPDRDGT